MENKWMDLLEECGVYANSLQEAEQIEHGLRLYLYNYGLRDKEPNEYRLGFMRRSIERLPLHTRKDFFMAYPLLREYEELLRLEAAGEKAGNDRQRYELAAKLEQYPALAGFWEPLF